jgi:uncharacterized membrane protein YkvA (DUF1232 family)
MLDQLMANVQGFWFRAKLTWRLLQDDRVPMWAKAIPVVAVLYMFSPIDILPDFLLGFGQIDDFMIIIGGMELFERMIPAEIVEEHRGVMERDRELHS